MRLRDSRSIPYILAFREYSALYLGVDNLSRAGAATCMPRSSLQACSAETLETSFWTYVKFHKNIPSSPLAAAGSVQSRTGVRAPACDTAACPHPGDSAALRTRVPVHMCACVVLCALLLLGGTAAQCSQVQLQRTMEWFPHDINAEQGGRDSCHNTRSLASVPLRSVQRWQCGLWICLCPSTDV